MELANVESILRGVGQVRQYGVTRIASLHMGAYCRFLRVGNYGVGECRESSTQCVAGQTVRRHMDMRHCTSV